jgi:amino acid transporter
MAFFTTKQPPTQRESMIATIVLAAMMMSGLIYAVTSPVDWIVRFTIAASIVFYVFGIVAVLVLQKRQPESAYNLFRVTVPSGAALAVLGYMIYGIAKHPHDLLQLLR